MLHTTQITYFFLIFVISWQNNTPEIFAVEWFTGTSFVLFFAGIVPWDNL